MWVKHTLEAIAAGGKVDLSGQKSSWKTSKELGAESNTGGMSGLIYLTLRHFVTSYVCGAWF
jgi:hypothetical protein